MIWEWGIAGATGGAAVGLAAWAVRGRSSAVFAPYGPVLARNRFQPCLDDDAAISERVEPEDFHRFQDSRCILGFGSQSFGHFVHHLGYLIGVLLVRDTDVKHHG